MALANLFSKLSAVKEDVKSPDPPAFTHRNQTEKGKRGDAGKRETRGEQTGSSKKRKHYQMGHGSFSFTKEEIHSYKDQAGGNNMRHKGQNYKAKNSYKVNQQQGERNQRDGQKNDHQHRGRGRPATRGGSHRPQPHMRKDGGSRNNQNNEEVKRPKLMTEEFKRQNVVEVDGRLLCRHFMRGRCIKGDDCQLEHVQLHNDIIKEVCKFYIQGFCTSGASCPYMHESFPCKYFHKKGKCFQEADCKFSHEPLNDLTQQLLDEVLKREHDLCELSKTAEQGPPGQPVNTDQPEVKEVNKFPDILDQPIRPNFYKSTDANMESEDFLHQTEERAENVEEAVPLHAPDAVQSHRPPSATLPHEEPVCYSVEAVLGPQLSKPFTGFFTTSRSQEFVPLLSDYKLDSSQVPYSVDAVLGAYKSMENSTFGDTPNPPTTQTVSYTPQINSEELTDPLLNSETKDKRHLSSVNTENEMKKSKERKIKSLSSLQDHTGLISKTCLNDALASGDHKTQGLNNDIICSVNRRGDGVFPVKTKSHKNIFSEPPNQTSSKHPEQLTGLTSNSQASFQSFCPSSGFTKFKSPAAVSAELVTSPFKSSDSPNSSSCHFATKKPTEIHPHSKIAHSGMSPGTKRQYSTETTAECSSGKAYCGDLAVGCKKIPFHGLFASPVTDTLQPVTGDPVTSSSCSQGLSLSPSPALQAADCKSNHLITALEPDKASARPFCSLFATPLNAAPLPCKQSPSDNSKTSSHSQKSVQLFDNTFHLSDSKQAASNSERPKKTKETSYKTRLHDFAPNPNTGTNNLTVSVNQPGKQPVNLDISLMSESLCEKSVSSAPCGESQSSSPTHPPHSSSHKGSAGDAENSVLKTLFLCMSPYQQDGGQQDSTGSRPLNLSSPSSSVKTDYKETTVLSDIRQRQESIHDSVPPGNEKIYKRGTEGDFVRQQQKSEMKSRQKKKLQTQDIHKQSPEERVARLRKHQSSLQTPHIPTDATGASTLDSSEMTEPQVRDPDAHNVPFSPAVPSTHTSEEGERVDERAATTPLKELFKTLDTAVFHFGR